MKTGITRMYEGLFDERSIYISDIESAHDLVLLKTLNITAVVSVAKQFKITYPSTIIQEYLHIPAIDTEDYNISDIFDTTFAFIDSVHLKRNVLIHCGVGVSRSASVFIAYLIRKHGFSYQNAFNMAKKRRPIINPNKGFIESLKQYSSVYSSEKTKRNQKLERTLSKQLQNPPQLQKKYSLELCKKMQENNEQQDKEMTNSSKNTQQWQMNDKLNQILLHKQKVQDKLLEIQKYYKDPLRNIKFKDKQKGINSCFEYRNNKSMKLNLSKFQKSSSSQI